MVETSAQLNVRLAEMWVRWQHLIPFETQPEILHVKCTPSLLTHTSLHPCSAQLCSFPKTTMAVCIWRGITYLLSLQMLQQHASSTMWVLTIYIEENLVMCWPISIPHFKLYFTHSQLTNAPLLFSLLQNLTAWLPHPPISHLGFIRTNCRHDCQLDSPPAQWWIRFDGFITRCIPRIFGGANGCATDLTPCLRTPAPESGTPQTFIRALSNKHVMLSNSSALTQLNHYFNVHFQFHHAVLLSSLTPTFMPTPACQRWRCIPNWPGEDSVWLRVSMASVCTHHSGPISWNIIRGFERWKGTDSLCWEACGPQHRTEFQPGLICSKVTTSA